MNVPAAWAVTAGCNTVRVAILDNGVELSHPDLAGNLLPGFDATGGGNNGNATGTGAFDAHGTNCAGIVAATANNGMGVAGVAHNSRIVPVKVGSGQTLDFQAMAAGIDWLTVNNFADIVNISAGTIGASNQLVTDEINRATSIGRNGLGIVFFAITQNNSSGTVAYPAILQNVIAVGSLDQSNTRVSTSNYGTGLDVVAPGSCIYTTDLQGSAGQTSNDYWTCFSGTSAASPNAAGVMALILSINPNLTLAQARQILESNTDKLSGYTFTANVSGQPNGTWNNEVGYGKVNANKAALAASASAIIGPSLVCDIANYSLQFRPVGSSVSWSSSDPSILFINQNTGDVTRQNGNSGSVTITANASTPSGCNVVYKKSIFVGVPIASNSTLIYPNGMRGIDPVSLCASCTYNFLVDFVAGANSYSWVLPPGFSFVSGCSTSTPGIRTSAVSGTYTLYCSQSNACPGSVWTHNLTINIGGGGEQQQMISVYPNPTSTDLTIEATYSDLTISDNSATVSSVSNSPTFSAKLTEQFNSELQNGISVNGKIVFDVHTIQKGIYYLHVIRENELIVKQILIDK